MLTDIIWTMLVEKIRETMGFRSMNFSQFLYCFDGMLTILPLFFLHSCQ